ncbi:hypothetical protein H0H93_007506 [Arthromyces matolae]|nr:hypothetical protein H0H93_007506 [Arthromyces matolae]
MAQLKHVHYSELSLIGFFSLRTALSFVHHHLFGQNSPWFPCAQPSPRTIISDAYTSAYQMIYTTESIGKYYIKRKEWIEQTKNKQMRRIIFLAISFLLTAWLAAEASPIAPTSQVHAQDLVPRYITDNKTKLKAKKRTKSTVIQERPTISQENVIANQVPAPAQVPAKMRTLSEVEIRLVVMSYRCEGGK